MSRRPLLIAGVGVVAVVGLWFVLLWAPQSGRLADAAARRDDAEAANTQLEQRVRLLRGAGEESAEMEAALDDVNSAIPEQPRHDLLLVDVEDAARAAGVELSTITPTPPTAGKGGVSQVPVNLAVTGQYGAVLSFIERLETLPRIVVIDGLDVSSAPDGTLTVAISARMFTTAAPAGAKPAQPAPSPAGVTGSTGRTASTGGRTP